MNSKLKKKRNKFGNFRNDCNKYKINMNNKEQSLKVSKNKIEIKKVNSIKKKEN